MKRAASIAIVLLLWMWSPTQPAQAQSGKQEIAPISLSLQDLTKDTGKTRFAGPWQEVSSKSFFMGNQTMSGQASAIAVDLVNDPSGNTVYVGSSSGGVWKSTNGLSANPRFVPISDQRQSLSVGAIALDTRTKPAKIYVGTGAPDNSGNIGSYTGTGILSSTDDGHTWVKVDSADSGTHSFVGLGFSRILIDPQNPDILLAATGLGTDPNRPQYSLPQGSFAFYSLGIYRSTDAGKTWKRMLSANYTAQPPATCGQIPDVLRPAGFFHMEMLFEPIKKRYFVHITGQELHVSNDQGASWTTIAAAGLGKGLPSGNLIFKASLARRKGSLWAFLLMNPCDPNSQFALFHSLDQGATWNPMELPGEPLFKGSLMYVAAPPDSNLVLVATALMFATDTSFRKVIWTSVQNNTHVDQHAVAFVNASTWYVGNDGGAWVTTNSGQTWTSLNADLRTLEFYSADEEPGGVFAGGLQDNGVVLATLGSAWNQIIGSHDGIFMAADPVGHGAFFLTTEFGTLFYVRAGTPASVLTLANFSTDFMMPFEILQAGSLVRTGVSGSGKTIVQNGRVLLAGARELPTAMPSPTPAFAPALVAFDPNSPLNPCQNGTSCNTAIATNPQIVILTKSIGQSIHYLAPVPGDASKAYVVTDSSLFLLTNISFAGNATVTQIAGSLTSPLNGNVLGHIAAASDGNTLYLLKPGFILGQKVFKTTDAGKTWTNISSNLPNVPMNWIALDPLNPGTIFIASDVSVFETRNDGATWARLGTGLPNVPVTQLKIVPGRQLLAATYGRNAWLLSDPCDPEREQLAGIVCDQSDKTSHCFAALKALALKLKTCEAQNGEL